MQAAHRSPEPSGHPSRRIRERSEPRAVRLRQARVGCLLLGVLALAGPVRALAVDAPSCSAFAAGGPACGVEPVGSSPVGNDADRFVANPIDVVTGNKYQHRQDYRAFGSRLSFSRHYNTARTDVDVGLGRGWRHDYDVSLARTGETGLRVFQSDGRQIDFEAVGVDAALAAGIDADALSTGAIPHLATDSADGHLLLGDGATWHMVDGRELRFRGQYLAGITWPDGDRLDLGYRDGRLASVTDRHGRSVRLEYTPGRRALDGWEPATDVRLPGHLERVVLPDGSALDYRYDNRRNLVRVDHDGERIERLTYADRDFPSHLTGLDAEGEAKRWHHDDEGRGDGYADGFGSVLMLEYLPEPMDSSGLQAGRTLVKRRDGAWLDYRWTVDASGVGGIEAIIEHGCETCAGVPRPMNRVRRGETAGTDPDAKAIAGITVESLGANTAVVSGAGLPSPITVQFDRRGRPVRVDSFGPASDGIAVREAVRLLDGAGTVDGSGTAYAARNRANCPPPVFRTCDELKHDRQLLEMSNCAYDVQGTPCAVEAEGWTELTPADLGIDDSLMHFDNFDARAWRNDATGEVVVAFRGSDDTPDWIEDAVQFNGVPTSSYYLARNLADVLLQGQYGGNITYTGHSLGGGLATAAALRTGREAVVFNSAALSPATAQELRIDLTSANDDILGIHVEGEFVTTNQDRPWIDNPPVMQPDGDRNQPWEYVSNPAPGQRYPIPPHPNNSWLQDTSAMLHTRGALIESLDYVIQQQCNP